MPSAFKSRYIYDGDGGPPRDYNMAWAFGGLAIPPGTCNGMLAKKNVHLWSRSHKAAKPRRSNSSPIGMPHPAMKTSWMDGRSGEGYTS